MKIIKENLDLFHILLETSDSEQALLDRLCDNPIDQLMLKDRRAGILFGSRKQKSYPLLQGIEKSTKKKF
ncbi:MAG: hypothetical protein ACSNEK_04850 [Parachlamydiaceae bacterium]